MQNEISEKTRRVLTVVLKGIIGLIATGVMFWLAWYEYGIDIFINKTVMLALAMWLILGFAYFLHEIGEATEKTTNEILSELSGKIDTLIEEIRQDRNERNKNKPT